jgi:hypothetical protein
MIEVWVFWYWKFEHIKFIFYEILFIFILC